jgi:putative copper resistance protein D
MAYDLQLAMRVATVTLNLAVAVAVGATAAAPRLSRDASPWAVRQCRRVHLANLVGLTMAMLASAWLLLFEAASMAEVTVAESGGAVWIMLTATHLGAAWTIGICALAASLAAAAGRGRGHARWLEWPGWLQILGLAVFFYTRSMVSHAASEGDFSAAMLADWTHLALVSLWVGEVVVAGTLILANPVGDREQDRNAAARYVEALSVSATFALAGLVATGVFSAWHNLGSAAALTGNLYGTTLLIKAGLVGVAVVIGGCNRFIVMPSLLDGLRRNDAAGVSQLRRFTLILRLETVVLLSVLIAAAVLSSTSPPGAA